MAAVQAAVAMAANHFTGLDNTSEEIYFTCRPYKMKWRQMEILPGSWGEILPAFIDIEVRKRPKSIRAVQEQGPALGPSQQPPSPHWWLLVLASLLLFLSWWLSPKEKKIDK